MPSRHLVRSVKIARSARVAQLEGFFDLPPTATSDQVWDVDLPIEARPWSVGLIVGPSGSGKSTVAREMFGARVVAGFQWPEHGAVVDGFPKAMSIKAITALLSSVGFSSPPAWLRPFGVLSTGEQFRVTLARALAESGTELTVMDEFTSVVDRRVAQIGSAALAKTVRRDGQQFVAVTCHYDVEEWLQPDWVYQPHLQQFDWRDLQRRPPITLRLTRCRSDSWARFRQHHYLNTDLAHAARCFLTWWNDEPVGFTAVMSMMGFSGRWREHRTVCLPEFQGVGIGMAQSRLVAAIAVAATGGTYHSTTSHPAFVAARIRSNDWLTRRAPSIAGGRQRLGGDTKYRLRPRIQPSYRMTSSFQFVGEPWPDRAQAVALWSESFAGGSKLRTTTGESSVTSG